MKVESFLRIKVEMLSIIDNRLINITNEKTTLLIV